MADTWKLDKDDSLVFAATSDLEVKTDGKGTITYGLSSTAKQSISAASSAASTVTENLGKIEKAASSAVSAASSASGSALAGKYVRG